jgi:hypothetical protein
MGTAVSITRVDLTVSELRKAASGRKDIALVACGALALSPPLRRFAAGNALHFGSKCRDAH